MALFMLFVFLLLTLSAPAGWQGSVRYSFILFIIPQPTDLRRQQMPRFVQAFLPWAVENRPHQEGCRSGSLPRMARLYHFSIK